jgi:hypothetical protein
MSLRMITDLKPSDFVYSGVTANKYGGKAIYLNGPGRSRLMFQLPALKAIVGLKESALAPGTWNMPLSLDNEAVLKVFQDLENFTIDTIVANSVELTGKKLTRELVVSGDSWKPFIKESKKEGYAPILRMNPQVDKTTNKFLTEAYNSKREPVPLESLDKGQRVSCIIEISQIWKSTMGYGLSMRLHQVMFSPSSKLAPCAFLPSEAAPMEEDANSAEEETEYEEESD